MREPVSNIPAKSRCFPSIGPVVWLQVRAGPGPAGGTRRTCNPLPGGSVSRPRCVYGVSCASSPGLCWPQLSSRSVRCERWWVGPGQTRHQIAKPPAPSKCWKGLITEVGFPTGGGTRRRGGERKRGARLAGGGEGEWTFQRGPHRSEGTQLCICEPSPHHRLWHHVDMQQSTLQESEVCSRVVLIVPTAQALPHLPRPARKRRCACVLQAPCC